MSTVSHDDPQPPARRPRGAVAAPVPGVEDATKAMTTVSGARPTPEPTPSERPAEVARVADLRPARPAPAVPVRRRYRHTVTKVDLWSVTKLSICFYLSGMLVVMVAISAIWLFAESAGVIEDVEKFIGDLVQSNDFHFLSGDVLRGAILIALAVVGLQIVITVVAASFYNIFAELFGGLEITVKEDPDDGD